MLSVAAISMRDNVKQVNLSDQSFFTAAQQFVVY